MKKLTLLSAAALAAAFTFTACKKDKKEDKAPEPATTDPATADKPVEPATPPPEAPPPEPVPPEPAMPERPASVTDEHVKMADDFVAGLDAAATAAEGAKSDCKAMGKALAAQAKTMKGQVAKLDAMKKATKDPAAMEWFKATYEPKVGDSYGKLMTAVEPCKTDKAVVASLKNIAPKKTKEEGGPAVHETEPKVK